MKNFFSEGRGGVYKKVMSDFNCLNFNLPFISFNILHHHITARLLLHPPPEIFKEIRKKVVCFLPRRLMKPCCQTPASSWFIRNSCALNEHSTGILAPGLIYSPHFFSRDPQYKYARLQPHIQKNPKEMDTYFCTWSYTTWNKMPNLLICLSQDLSWSSNN